VTNCGTYCRWREIQEGAVELTQRTSMECIVYHMRRVKVMAVLTCRVYVTFHSVVTCLAELHFIIVGIEAEVISTYQPMNARIISHNTHLKHLKTLRHVSILLDHHQGALFLAKVILQYAQFNSYLQTRCCGSISCCVGMCCGAVARCASHATHT